MSRFLLLVVVLFLLCFYVKGEEACEEVKKITSMINDVEYSVTTTVCPPPPVTYTKQIVIETRDTCENCENCIFIYRKPTEEKKDEWGTGCIISEFIIEIPFKSVLNLE